MADPPSRSLALRSHLAMVSNHGDDASPLSLPTSHRPHDMTPNEIARVEDYLRRTFANDRITIVAPKKRNGPIEVYLGEEFIGVLHRDDDEGEVSYALQMTILEEDLPVATALRGGKDKR